MTPWASMQFDDLPEKVDDQGTWARIARSIQYCDTNDEAPHACQGQQGSDPEESTFTRMDNCGITNGSSHLRHTERLCQESICSIGKHIQDLSDIGMPLMQCSASAEHCNYCVAFLSLLVRLVQSVIPQRGLAWLSAARASQAFTANNKRTLQFKLVHASTR